MTLRVLIADDELMARKRLQRLLGGVPDVEVVGEAVDGTEVLALLRDGLACDLVLLDVQMPNLTGVETLGLLGADRPQVVFTTAHADYAIPAFDGGATDYLLKPIEAARLVRALDRVRERLANRTDAREPSRRVAVPTRKGVVLMAPDDLGHAAIDGESVVLHTRKGRFYKDFRLGELERRFPTLLRVHRQALVNVDRIDRLEDADSGGYVAVLDDGARIQVSRQVARQLRRAWDL